MRLHHLLLVAAVLLLALPIGYVSQAAASEAPDVPKGSAVQFQAEVAKMLDILVNSLYTKRDIFLRELISNGSDALDKIRVMYLTEAKKAENKDGEEATMDLHISTDPEKHQLIIRDGGIGMTKEELAAHLGTLGTSGTKRFLEQVNEEGGTPSSALIGQFGVGFYSVFLVGSSVQVASKSDKSDKQYVWESTGDGTFFVYEDPRGNTLGRGTEITITLKKDAYEYHDMDRVKHIIHQYSEFIDFPIYVWDEIPAPPTDADEERLPEPEMEDYEDMEDYKRDYEEWKSKLTKPIIKDWVLVNKNKPIWTRPTSEVFEEDYNNFYKSLTNDYADPLYYSHFRVEGEVEFSSILFVPSEADASIFTQDTIANNIKLYVRRVFITDEFRDLLPRYLNFVRGVVDSDDLPLNVSREVLQENRILRVIKKKLVRKALGMFADIAAQDARLENGQANTAESVPAGTKTLTEPTYVKFWEKFGKHLRMGIMEDTSNRGRIAKLLRYHSSRNESAYISLQDYKEAMREGQKGIYYITGDSVEQITRSPVLGDALARGVEVLYMTDAIDEYVVSNLPDFGGKKLINLAKEGVMFDDENPTQRIIEKKRREKYTEFFKALHSLFGKDEVRKIIVSRRFTTEAFVLSSGDSQLTARLANIIRGSAIAPDSSLRADRILEVNHRHPLVEELYKRFTVDETDPIAIDMAWVLYDTANMQAEFPVKNLAAYASRVNRLLRSSVDISSDEELLPSDDDELLKQAEEDEKREEEEKAAKKKKEEEEKDL